MKYWVNSVLSLLIVMAMSPAHAQQDIPQLGVIESWGCQMNEGQSMSDLIKVVDDWNEWSDDNGIDAYSAWVLSPIFKANADFVREAGWFGYAPNFTEMGKVMQTWMTKGQKLNARFNKVWTCGWHSQAATMLVRLPADGPSSAVVSRGQLQ